MTTELNLQNLTSEKLKGATAIEENGGRLDIVADGLWGGKNECSYFDVHVRVINPMLVLTATKT